MKKLLLLLPFVLLTSVLFGQEDDYEIDAVEVVSLQIPVDVDESGRSVTILKAEEIAELPFTSIDELLRYLPGVNVNSRGGFGVQTDLGMRGSNFSQVLILIDGVRFSEPLTAHLNFSLPIPLNEIAQIEVIRGPASAMYGADAVGGLIHIKTKTFSAKEKKKGVQTSGNFYYGEHSLADGDAMLGYNFGKVQLSAGLKKTTSDGEEFANPNFGVSEEPTYNTDFDIEAYTFGVNFKVNETWTINGRYAKDQRDFAAKYFYTASSYDESRETTGNELAQISLLRSKGRSNTNFSMSYREGTDYFLFNPLFPANDHTTDRYLAILQHNFTTDGDVDLGFGLQAEQMEIESTDRGNHEQEQIEGFFTALFPVNDFSFMLSQRMGMNSDYGVNYTPQGSVSYNKDRFSLRSSAGWAVRAPDFTERYVSDLIPQLSAGRNLGNSDLQAEESFTIDFGGSVLPHKNLKLSASVFYRNSKDLIDYVLTPEQDINNATNLIEGAEYLYARNVGEASTSGFELEGDWEKNISNTTTLRVNGNYSFLSTNLEENINSKYLANHPNHIINFDARVRAKKFLFSLNNQWVTRDGEAIENIAGKIEDSYFLSSIKAGYEVMNGLQIQLRGTNLFDIEYQEILGAQMPGRWMSGGVQWSFE